MTRTAPDPRRRLDNQARQWQARFEGCANYTEAVRVSYDRARAAARAAERGGDTEAWKDLMQLLNRWCEAMEQRQAQRAAR